MSRSLALLLSLSFMLLPGCTSLRPDPLTAEQHLAQAAAFRAKRDYAAAAESLGKTISKGPASADLYLQQGEMFEVARQPKQAKTAYRNALATLPASDAARPELSYRLLQVLTIKLDEADEAPPLLSALAAGSVRYLDAQGCIAYGDGRYDEALRLFEQARERETDPDMVARILYHEALAYDRLGDEDRTMVALFHAINQAQSLGVSKDIEHLFNRLKGLTY